MKKTSAQKLFWQQMVQIGMLLITLGGVLCLMGLYPGITGVEPRSGIGILQIMLLLAGMLLIIIGELIFVKVAFYPDIPSTLAQRIAIRLSLTGLLFAAAVGLSDVLGYGSNPPDGAENIPVLGIYQAGGIVFGFVMASLGVLLFVIAGPDPLPPEPEEDSLTRLQKIATQPLQPVSLTSDDLR